MSRKLQRPARGAAHTGKGEKNLKVTVRLFASYREKTGKAVVELELAKGATVGSLAEEVQRQFPTITRDVSKLVVAVNDEYQNHEHILDEGDEVALIPPVSGGCFCNT